MITRNSASREDEIVVVLPFPGSTSASIEHVGGKGHSLIRLACAGLTVPPGVVLTSHFFEPWIAPILDSADWRLLQDAAPGQWKSLCDSIKAQAVSLPLDDFQKNALDRMQAQLASLTSAELFAVRSSSPQEDLHGVSFAGGYETRLGIKAADLVDAIRSCFASMFDERVIAYKAACGLRLASPSMAVVIQQQVDSDVAGVAFSLNPLNNDYDQAVINANWGQGETVVAGLVTPDSWVLDKLTGGIIEHSIGDKQVSRWLQADGSLIDRRDYRCLDACLSVDQLGRLLAQIKLVETSFQHPVDIEWAIANDIVYLLQARPVTAFVPLPESLLTAPGQRRRLYMDIALSSGLTINAPISPMGLDTFRRLFADLTYQVFGRLDLELGADDGLVMMEGGRMYLDLSNAMWLGSPRRMAKKMQMSDAMVARILETVDPQEYKAKHRPVWARFRMLWRVPRAWWRLRGMLATSILPFIAPRHMHRRITRRLRAYERELGASADYSLPLDSFWTTYVTDRLRTLMDVSLPCVAPAVFGVKAFEALSASMVKADDELRDKLDRGFEGNVVVAMSLEMYRLARQIEPGQHLDAQELERLVNSKGLPTPFMEAWNGFIRQFGSRGPMEMDLAHPRYADAPLIALKQIVAMSVNDADADPVSAARRQVERRRKAAATVIARSGLIRRGLLRRLNTVTELFAGLRDTPKQHLLMILHDLRRRIVLEGELLHRLGRLDEPTHVFDLTFEELAAGVGAELDLRAIRAERRKYYDQLTTQVINFPPVIDSRGRILRSPPAACRDGEFCGVGLSPGLVSGFARTLRSPHEKPLLKGEVLIAYTTDPGWTPIFTNAAAVVLEIGGALQHGAVVARELGLPCVAGIAGISTAIKDGELIEVDGSTGVVRLVAVSCV